MLQMPEASQSKYYVTWIHQEDKENYYLNAKPLIFYPLSISSMNVVL